MMHLCPRTIRRVGLAAVVAAGLGLGLMSASVSCDRASGAATSRRPVGGQSFVFTQVPAGRLPASADAASFRDPYPAGSRIAIYSAGDSAPAILSTGLSAAGDPAVTPDGKTILFSGRTDANTPWGLFEVSAEGGTPRRITPAGFNAVHPAVLPNGRVIFSADAHGGIDPADGGKAFAIHTCKLDGSDLTRITFNPGSDVEPTVQWENRVLYASRSTRDDGSPSRWIIQGIRSDGTMVSGFVGMDRSESYRRPLELPGRLIAMTTFGGDSPETLQTVGTWRPTQTLRPAVDTQGLLVRSASDAGDGKWVVSTKADASYGVSIVDPSEPGMMKLVYDDPAFDEIDARRVFESDMPRGFISMLKPETPGQLLCLDAGRGANPDGSDLQMPATKLRVYRGNPAGPDGKLEQELIFEAPLARDGSVLYRQVPYDVPLRFETVDEAGNALSASHSWVWVRPGEIRGCIGCHENPESGPINRMPDAVSPQAPRTDGKSVSPNGGGM